MSGPETPPVQEQAPPDPVPPDHDPVVAERRRRAVLEDARGVGPREMTDADL